MTAAEVAHLRLRDKNALTVYCTQFIFDFIVTLTLPYLLDAGKANLQSKVGFIYGGCGVLGLIWAYFCLPDMTGRSLEELEEMWAERVPAREFRSMSFFLTCVVLELINLEWKPPGGTAADDNVSKVAAYPKDDPRSPSSD